MRKTSSTPNEQATAFLNVRLVDPASGKDEPGGLLVKDGVIADLGSHLRRNAPEGAKVIDGKGHVLCPGLIDMQVFTGEPGQEHRETLKTASHAAAAGGVTTMVVMPDTEPVIDQVALVDFIQRRARDNAIVNVHVMAAVTRGLKGQDMTELGLLQRAGAIASSTAMRTATPISTWSRMTLREWSAMVDAISTPRFMGPGCMISASGLARASFSWSRPKKWKYSRVEGT